ncbi:MAG: isochorismatase family cysteine hydrolase [Pseudomonadota bacterium]
MPAPAGPGWAVAADPYPWPLEPLRPADCALMVIDMQRDFCAPDGYVAQIGEDIAPLAACIQPIQRCLAAARRAGMRVVYTRQGFRPDLADVPAWRRIKAARYGAVVGRQGPLGRVLIRGEPGFQILPELAPQPGEPVVDKTANGAFTGTDLDRLLMAAGIRALAFAGVTIDVCVHSTLREATDRGYHGLLIADACGAVDPDLHAWALRSVTVEGGIFGAVATTAQFEAGLAPPPAEAGLAPPPAEAGLAPPPADQESLP